MAQNPDRDRMLMLLSNGPAWASGAGTPTNYPSGHVQDFFDFCTAVCERYPGQIGAFEIWNEPNGADTPWTSAQYKEVLLGAEAAIHAVDSTALIAGPTLAGVPGDSTPWNNFLQTLLSDSEFTAKLDILSYHIYTRPQPPETGLATGPLDDRLTNTQTNLSGVGWTKPQWCSESGYAVDSGNPSIDVSEADQARFLVRTLIISRSYIDKFLQFRLYNGNGYGLFDNLLAKRPAFTAMETAYANLQDKQPVREADQGGARVYSFGTNGYVSWRTSGTSSVTLNGVTQTASIDPVWWPAAAMAAAGTSTATAVGQAAGNVGTAAGVSTATAVGASVAEAVGSSVGVSTAAAVGKDLSAVVITVSEGARGGGGVGFKDWWREQREREEDEKHRRKQKEYDKKLRDAQVRIKRAPTAGEKAIARQEEAQLRAAYKELERRHNEFLLQLRFESFTNEITRQRMADLDTAGQEYIRRERLMDEEAIAILMLSDL